MQGRNVPGKIFPPLIIIEYGEATHQDVIQNTELTVEYKISFTLAEKEFKGAIEVLNFIFDFQINFIIFDKIPIKVFF